MAKWRVREIFFNYLKVLIAGHLTGWEGSIRHVLFWYAGPVKPIGRVGRQFYLLIAAAEALVVAHSGGLWSLENACRGHWQWTTTGVTG